jgi:hypothetical protein
MFGIRNVILHGAEGAVAYPEILQSVDRRLCRFAPLTLTSFTMTVRVNLNFHTVCCPHYVIPGLDPGIHVTAHHLDARNKSEHDNVTSQ